MIQVSHLSKNYGAFTAVRDVSFTVEKEQVLGFLGPNGAGKTTVMKILTGFHFPGSGEVFVNGIPVAEDPVACKRCIGYLPENVPLYGELTVSEYLDFIARSRLVPKSERHRRVSDAVEMCGLAAKRGARIETLSKGYRQRTGLAQAILHDPPILILDEPTTGLDPNQIIEIRTLVRDLGKRKTVILSTHILQEVEAVCGQVLILNEGRIAAQGTPDSIARTMRGGETWNLLLKGGGTDEVRDKLQKLAGEKAFVMENLVVEGRADAQAASFFIEGDTVDNGEIVFDWAVSQGFKLLEMRKKKLSLEDIFVRLTNEGTEGGAA